MVTETLIIKGMSCQHCVMAVKKELELLDGVRVIQVEIGKADIQYDQNKVNREAIREAIDEAGFTLES